MVRTLVVVVVAICGATALCAQTDGQAKSVAGVYLCEGNNPDGSPYVGVVEISAVKDTFVVHWQLGDQDDVFGVGIFRDGVLAVSYFGGAPAVAMYRPDGDRLIGQWTIGGADGKLFGETLTRMKEGMPRPEIRRPERSRPDSRPEQPRRRRPLLGTTEA
jgi:hypothetical protein